MNIYSLKLTATVINVFTVAKVLALIFVIVLGLWQLIAGGMLIQSCFLKYYNIYKRSLFFFQQTIETISQMLLKGQVTVLETLHLHSIQYFLHTAAGWSSFSS